MHTVARMIVSPIEEAEAINWNGQRIAVEEGRDARATLANAQREETKQFGMGLEFLLLRNPEWRETLERILCTGGVVAHSGQAEATT
ncbi:MAG: hypothetical protein U0556_16535 [Dehalococcoidia bacterium]